MRNCLKLFSKTIVKSTLFIVHLFKPYYRAKIIFDFQIHPSTDQHGVGSRFPLNMLLIQCASCEKGAGNK